MIVVSKPRHGTDGPVLLRFLFPPVDRAVHRSVSDASQFGEQKQLTLSSVGRDVLALGGALGPAGQRTSFKMLSMAVRRLGSTGSVMPQQRKVRTFQENIAVLRASLVVMFPPRRRNVLRVLKDLLTPEDYSAAVR